MSEHTPGPWAVLGTGIVGVGNDALVAAYSRAHLGEQAANARLIAAAPELLEALKEIAKGSGPFSSDRLTHAENTIEAMKRLAFDAIAKAEGRE